MFHAIPRLWVVQIILKNLILLLLQEEKLCHSNKIHPRMCINGTQLNHHRITIPA